MKTSHFEGRIALSAARTAQRRDEHTQREPATFDNHLGQQWLVAAADRPGPEQNTYSYNLEGRLATATINQQQTNQYYYNQSGIRTRLEMSVSGKAGTPVRAGKGW